MANQENEQTSNVNLDFECKIKDLTYGMDIVKSSLGSGKNIPILAGVKMNIGENELRLISTDREKTTTCTIPVENNEEPVDVVLKGDVLSKIMQRVPDEGTVRFVSSSEDGGEVELTSDGITFDLFQLPLEDYPSISTAPGDPIAEIEAPLFREALNQTIFAALKAKEATRLSLTGVNTIIGDEQMKMVATNGYRMALKTIDLPQAEKEDSYLIDSGALSQCDRILSKTGAETLTIHATNEEVFFTAEDVVFSDKLIMEDFPEYEGVIPQDNDLPVRVNRKNFLQTLRRAEITASEESGAVLLVTEEDSDSLSISSSSPEKGELKEKIPMLEPSKGDVEISFKAEFLIDALKRMGTEEVTFWLSDSDTAGLLEPSEGKGDFIYICMPISMETGAQ